VNVSQVLLWWFRAEDFPDFIDPSLLVDIEPCVYTTEEFLKMAEEGRRSVGEIPAYGRLLAGNPGVIEVAWRRFKSG